MHRVLLALPLLALPFTLACADFDCGYGGAGCGAASLVGACSGLVPLGVSIDIVIAFSDDTGAHEANVTSLDANPALRVTTLSQGRFRIVGLTAGATTLVAHIDGWSAPQRFDLTVLNLAGETSVPDGAMQSDAGPACVVVRSHD